MFRPRIYVDTSVIGGCLDDEFKAYSVQLFEEFISGKKRIVIVELCKSQVGVSPP
ncbi:MAG: hypothetical protein Q8K98_11795 [Bacteroidota bacterium]|nr:hypothetical protein [Bacteroidota bacterium]